jgi:hypothetical protein
MATGLASRVGSSSGPRTHDHRTPRCGGPPPLTDANPAARFAGGTDGYFVELNRRRPSADGLDRVSFALCPQAHATDDATVLENLQSLASMAESARALCGQRPLGLRG